jgi:hypothetical protein
MDAFMKEQGARLWIQHSLPEFRQRKRSPAYYE